MFCIDWCFSKQWEVLYIYIYIYIYMFSSGPLLTGFQWPYLSVFCVVGCSVPLPHNPLYFFFPTTSGRPRRHLAPDEQVIIRLCHLLSFMRTTCPFHFNTFSILSGIACINPFFPLITSFLSLKVLAVIMHNSISVFRSFFKNLYILVCVCVCVCIYIYIYISP